MTEVTNTFVASIRGNHVDDVHVVLVNNTQKPCILCWDMNATDFYQLVAMPQSVLNFECSPCMVGYHRIASQPKIETISFSPCVLYSTYWMGYAGISHTGRPGFS